MKLLALLVILYAFTPGCGLKKVYPDAWSNVYDYFNDVNVDFGEFKLEFKDIHQLAEWIQDFVYKNQDMRQETNGTPYRLDDDGLVHVVGCYFRRYWERKQYVKLTPAENFCKRISENSPNEVERRDQVRFKALRILWNSMKNITKIHFGPYSPTEEEKKEIEDCYFFQSWVNKANPTTHDLFCKRISNNEPNQIEMLEKTAFEAYLKEWTNMSLVASQDYRQISQCVLVELKFVPDPQERSCNGYFQLVYGPLNSWRDVRREEVHRCKRRTLRYKRTKECTNIFKNYKEKYCQNEC